MQNAPASVFLCHAVISFPRPAPAARADEVPNFLLCMLKADFPQDTRDIVDRALRGQFPDPPKAAPAPAE